MKSRKMYIKVEKDMCGLRNILTITVNDKELSVESDTNEFEVNEMGIEKLLELAMSDDEYVRWLKEQPKRIEEMADEVVSKRD